MSAGASSASRCGLDTVEIRRFERFLLETPGEDLNRLFSEAELQESGNGSERAARLAARFAAKEACCKLFPRETALGSVGPVDFAIRRDAYGAPFVEPSAAAQAGLDRRRVAGVSVCLTRNAGSASAGANGIPRQTEVPWFGKALYYLFPFRRRLALANLRLVFGDALPEADLRRLAQAYYAHFVRFLGEFVRLPFMSAER